MSITHFFKGKVMGFGEDWDIDVMGKKSHLKDDDYIEKEHKEKVNMLNKREEFKSKSGFSKSFNLNEKMFVGKNKAEMLMGGTIKKPKVGGYKMEMGDKVKNVRDLLSLSPGQHTDKTNMLMSLSRPKADKMVNVRDYLPSNKTNKAVKFNVGNYLPSNKSVAHPKFDVGNFVGGIKKDKRPNFAVSDYFTQLKPKTNVNVKGLVNKAKTKETSGMKIRELIGDNSFNPKGTMSQYRGLSNKPFGDFDKDGVANILDCQPRNKFAQEVFETYTDEGKTGKTEIALDRIPPENREEMKEWGPAKVSEFESYQAGMEQGQATQRAQQLAEDEFKKHESPGFIEQITRPVVGTQEQLLKSQEEEKLIPKRYGLFGEIKGRIKGAYQEGVEKREARKQAEVAQMPTQVAMERQAKYQRELARLREQYGYTPETKETGKTEKGKKGKTTKETGSKKTAEGSLAEATKAMSMGFGGGSGIGAAEKAALYSGGRQGTGMGLMVMSGAAGGSGGKTGFSMLEMPQQQTPNDKVTSLLGPTKFTPKQPVAPPQQIIQNAPQTVGAVVSPYSKRPVGYVRGPYSKQQKVVYIQQK
jgi:hypothetical protein